MEYKIKFCDLGSIGVTAQQTHKLIISKFPYDDIIEPGEIQKRSLVTEDLVVQPVVNVTTEADNIPVVDLAKPDKNVHITVGVEPESEEPREITRYLAGEFFFVVCLCPKTCIGHFPPTLSY